MKYSRFFLAACLLLFPFGIAFAASSAAAPSGANAPAELWVICGNLPGCGPGWNEYISPALWIAISRLEIYAEILAVLFIMIGGAFILLSAGNTERVTKGKNTIIWTVAGIFLIKATETVLGAITQETTGRASGADIIESASLTLISTVQDLFYIALLGVALYSGMRMAVTFGKTEEFNKARDGLFYAAIGAIIINWAGRIFAAFATM